MLLALTLQEGGGGQVEAIARTFGVDWPHLTAQIISFAIVCALLYLFAYKPVLRMLDERRQQIAQGLENTAKINAALAGIEAQRQTVIAEAQAQGARLVAEAREIGERLQAQEAERAVRTGERIIARAREEADEERVRMLADVRRDVGRLVVQTTAAVVGRVLTDDDQRRLAEETATRLSA